VFGDHGPRQDRFVTGVSNVLLAMAAVYLATSTHVSIFVAGTVALGVLGLGFLTGVLELTA
jgi:small basic protein